MRAAAREARGAIGKPRHTGSDRGRGAPVASPDADPRSKSSTTGEATSSPAVKGYTPSSGMTRRVLGASRVSPKRTGRYEHGRRRGHGRATDRSHSFLLPGALGGRSNLPT